MNAITTCPHGVAIPGHCTRCEGDITAGMQRLEWEPGTLESRELDRIITDALADLWRDCWRRGTTHERQRDMFGDRLRPLIRAAVGSDEVV